MLKAVAFNLRFANLDRFHLAKIEVPVLNIGDTKVGHFDCIMPVKFSTFGCTGLHFCVLV